MKLTIINGNGTWFQNGDEFEIYGEGFGSLYLMDEDDNEYQLDDLILDYVEFKVTNE